MQLTRIGSLPRLAWAAHAPSDGTESVAVCGNWVDATKGRIFEGAWNGAFDSGTFDESYSFMGTGYIERHNGVTAVASCDAADAIYSLEDHRGFFVSNSVPLLLKFTGTDLDPAYLDYEADVLTISRGVRNFTSTLHLADQTKARTHLYCNVNWSPRGGIVETEKATPRRPTNFTEYRTFLHEELTGITNNARHGGRRSSFEPIVFCSTGYDSTACAALGREVGCDEAVVYESKRGKRTDAGTDIVQSLHYTTIHEKQELEFMDSTSSHLFLGNGELASSIFFASAENELEGKVLLSGAHGDKMWGTDVTEPRGEISRLAYPDSAKKEFRLHVGFINLVIPFLTATIQPDINRISNLDEMDPWRLHTDYDRPIPRRIAEEAGVPRHAFGISKSGGAGSSLRFGNLRYLSRTMPQDDFKEFAPFWRKLRRGRKVGPKLLGRSLAYALFALATWNRRRGYAKLSEMLKISNWPLRYTCSPFAPSGLYVWAVKKLKETSYREVATIK